MKIMQNSFWLVTIYSQQLSTPSPSKRIVHHYPVYNVLLDELFLCFLVGTHHWPHTEGSGRSVFCRFRSSDKVGSALVIVSVVFSGGSRGGGCGGYIPPPPANFNNVFDE